MLQQAQQDFQYMNRAIKLAARGRFTTSPNPNVGCVIVNEGKVVGEGWHQVAGGPHAEVNALKQAGERAKGATCYVTLEPCSHFGKTPPCADALIKAGVGKVIAAMVDPNPQVSGRGLEKLKAAGIETHAGLLRADAQMLNIGFIKRMKGQGAFVRCKMACTLDGKTALSNGVSKWITGPDARSDVQRFRAQSCAIISGADTVITDNASLNVRWDELGLLKSQLAAKDVRQPARVIIDTQNRLTPDLKLFELTDQQSLGPKKPGKVILIRHHLDNRHQWPHFVEQMVVSQSHEKADLTELVDKLSTLGFNELWIEAGATLAGAFINQQLVDELIIYQAPKLIGDKGKSLLNLPEQQNMGQLTELNIVDVTMVGRDIRLTAKIEANSHKMNKGG
jgi:diaminohydroxyphosphoribosylaminopyrimidine deaminase/5-amino-6-(5-phosphoribosylamino)uracil reductase